MRAKHADDFPPTNVQLLNVCRHCDEIPEDCECIRVGDSIQFRSPTRDGTRTVWRKVVSLSPVCVRFQGWSEFQVHDDEIRNHRRGE